MKLLAIGNCVVDKIHSGGIRIQPGGMFYAGCALAAIKSEDDEINLITNMNRGYSNLFIPFWKNIHLPAGLNNNAMPIVNLIIKGEQERDEIYENFPDTAKVKINEELLKDCKGIYLNMITGFETDYNGLAELRKRCSGIIYMDIHSLTRPHVSAGSREFKRIKDIEFWLCSIDILQANDLEAEQICGSKDVEVTAEYVLNFGVSYFIITEGEKGTHLFFKKEAAIHKIFIHPHKSTGINKIGCGDVFGAVCFFYYLKTQDIEYSADKAATVAALVASYSDFKEFTNLKDYVYGK